MNWWIVGGAGIALIAIGEALQRLGRRQSTTRGMKQFARNPKAMRRMTDLFEERENMLARASELSDEEIQDLVEAIFIAEPDRRGTIAQVLEEVGGRAETQLIRALDDSRCDPAQESETWRDRPPFEIVAHLLAGMGSAAALPRMVGLIRNGTAVPRKSAALCVASVGNDEAITPTMMALSDADEYVRSAAIQGVLASVEAGRASSAFREAAFTALAQFPTGESGFSGFNDREAIGCLVAVDRDRAIGVLISPLCMGENNRMLAENLKALNGLGVSIDSAVLLPLLDRAKQTDKYPWSYVRTECLRMLVRVDPDLATREIELAMESPDKGARNAATEVLREVEGLSDAGRIPFTLDLNAIPRPVAHVLAAWYFQAEVNNGGISQYFFNSSGDAWPLAIEAFDTLGAKACAEILRESVAFFGKAGPSTNRDKRIKQYAAVSDEREKALDALSSRFYEDKDELDVCITRYMIRNKALFLDAIKTHVRDASVSVS